MACRSEEVYSAPTPSADGETEYAADGGDRAASEGPRADLAAAPHDYGGSIQVKALPLPTARQTIYVSSTAGNDSWSGRRSEPNSAGTDGPLSSLAAALKHVNGAAPGTHVLLRRGDTWNADAELQIANAIGTESDPVVLGAYGAGAQPDIVAHHAHNVFTIRGNASTASSYFRMDELRISSTRPSKGQVGIYAGESFHPHAPHHLVFSGVSVEHCGGGLTLYGDDHLLHGSRIAHNNLGMGVFVSGNNVRFRYNEFEDNGLPPPDLFVHTLYVAGSNDFVFEYNEVHSATDGVKVRRSARGVFRHNVFHDILNFAIHLGGDYDGGAPGNRIESNLFYRNAGDIVIKSESGKQIEPIDTLVIANNIIRSGSVAGTTPYGASITLTDVPARNVWVVNNLLFNLGDAVGIRIDNAGENIRCMNNIVTESKKGSAYALNSAVREGSNLSYASASNLKPLHLAAVARFDFSPTARSLMLIDEGGDVSAAIAVDFDGSPRPIGAKFDIGPYEYDPAKQTSP